MTEGDDAVRAPKPGLTRKDAAVVVAVTALSGVVFWLMHRALVDDSYITLVYARNLAEHAHWGLLPDRVSNTATSPLNVLLLGLFTFLLGGAVKGLAVVYLLNTVVLTWGLLGLGTRTGLGRRLALVAGPLLVLNPLLASTIGLETMLTVTALVFLVWTSAGPRAWPFGVVAGLTVLLRLDLAVVVVVVILLRRNLWKRLHWVALWAVVVAAPWYLFSWVVLGSAVPDTLLIKTGTGWGDYTTGLVSKYWAPYPIGVLGTLASCLVGAVSFLTWPLWRRRVPGDSMAVPVAGAGGLAYYLTFVYLGVSPFFWYYGIPVAGAVLCASFGIAALSRGGRRAVTRAVAAAVALLVALVPAGAAWANGIRTQAPLRIALVKGNWARPEQYTKIGRALPQVIGHDTPVKSPGEIGTLLFFCRCTMVDRFSDRGRLVHAINHARQTSPLMWLNYLWLDTADLEPIQPDYRLKWMPGHDHSGRGWNVYSRTGHRKQSFAGHLALIPVHHPRQEES